MERYSVFHKAALDDLQDNAVASSYFLSLLARGRREDQMLRQLQPHVVSVLESHHAVLPQQPLIFLQEGPVSSVARQAGLRWILSLVQHQCRS